MLQRKRLRAGWVGVLFFALSFPAFGVLDPNPPVALRTIAQGLTSPLAITNAGDGSGRLFITQQLGQLVIYDGNALLPTPFLDISSRVLNGGERGLLSVAFHPDYENNGFFYVYYTDLNGDTVVARFSVSSGDPNVADPNSEVILLQVDQPFANHNGGQMHFGPDGYLYIALGDGGSANDPQNRAQNLQTLLGKMLRIDVNGPAPYGIPPDNPFAGATPGLDEIWHVGLRNPWRFSFDRQTGDMFIGDVGQNAREEVDFQPAGVGGLNYGWRVMEGTLCNIPDTNLGCNDPSFTPPIIEYTHDDGDCTVIGGNRYRGTDVPALAALYVYADYCSGKIWFAEPQQPGGAWQSVLFVNGDSGPAAFGEDEAGELYMVNINSGILQRFEVDTDLDDVADAADNCTQVANTNQRDTDGDGIGNMCDPDLNNDNVVNFEDLARMKAVFLSSDQHADLNGDGAVNFPDLAIMKAMFLQEPGPSARVPAPAARVGGKGTSR